MNHVMRQSRRYPTANRAPGYHRELRRDPRVPGLPTLVEAGCFTQPSVFMPLELLSGKERNVARLSLSLSLTYIFPRLVISMQQDELCSHTDMRSVATAASCNPHSVTSNARGTWFPVRQGVIKDRWFMRSYGAWRVNLIGFEACGGVR